MVTGTQTSEETRQMPADPVRFALLLAREFIDPDRDPPRMTNREVVQIIDIALNCDSVTVGLPKPLKTLYNSR